MIKHRLCLGPSPAIQEILEVGRGIALTITISHSEDTPQHVAFYDREGNLLAEYQVHPMRSPWSITYANRDSFKFNNGLKVFTGACTVNLTLAY